jgi:hypothetical protein
MWHGNRIFKINAPISDHSVGVTTEFCRRSLKKEDILLTFVFFKKKIQTPPENVSEIPKTPP